MNNILIVGNYGTFCDELINKFYKEEWHIYILLNKKKIPKPAHVFEQFQYPYESDSIKEVIGSCNPDVILFLGAYDPYFKWEENREGNYLNYLTGLSNLLLQSATLGVRHFIYVSSDEVFEDKYAIDIKEDMPVSPNSLKGMTISQGESLAMHFNEITQMEVTVTRMAHMYGIPANREACTDIYSNMCLEVLKHGRLEVNAKRILSALFIKDAVEALYLLINAQERQHSTYHISSMEEVTEDEVVKVIQDNYSHPIDIVDRTVGLRHRTILSNKRFCKEFSFQVRNSYKEIIPQIISFMNNHKGLFLRSKDNKEKLERKQGVLQILKKALPFLESIIIFIPIFLLNNRIAESHYFNEINLYLLYVLLFAVIHGRQQAVVTSLLSVIGYCFRRMYTVSGFDLLIDINTYIWIVQIFIVGLTVGHLKDNFHEMEEEKNEKSKFLSERLKDVTNINNANVKIKNYFTEKLINSKEGIGRIYDITSKLQNADKGEVLFTALDTLMEIMGTKDVSIYLVSNPDYCRLASASSEKARSLGKSIMVKEYREIFDTLEKKQVFINRTLDHSFPAMASALLDEKNNMRIVIFLWNIPYEKMTLYEANVLTVVGALVYSVFVRDADYLEALSYRRFLLDTTILQEEAFGEMVNIYKNAGEEGYAESCIFYVKDETRDYKQLHEIIYPLLRASDYIGILKDGNLAILLTNTNKQEAMHVRTRLEKVGIQTYLEHQI